MRRRTQLFIIAVFLFAWFPVSSAETPIDFPDPQVEAAVREVIGKPTGPLTSNDLATVEYLNLFFRGVTDLTGLEAAVNLTRLDAFWNSITDLTPVTGLPALQALDVSYNPVGNLAMVSNLVTLTTLICEGVPVTNAAFVQYLPALRYAYMNGCGIGDAAPFTNLVSLLGLGLSENPLTNVEIVAAFPDLDTLLLSSIVPPLTNASFCSGLTNLTYLALGGNNVSDITPLLGLSRLQILELDGNGITNAAGISALVELRTLSISSGRIRTTPTPTNGLTDLGSFSGLSNLENLIVSGNQIVSLGLSNMPALQHLGLFDCGLTELSFVTNFPILNFLDVSANQLTDISPLKLLPNLQTLSIRENLLSDITPLDFIPGLNWVTVAYNYIDLNRRSPGRKTIEKLLAHGVSVEYGGQTYRPRAHLIVTNATPGQIAGYVEFDGDEWSSYAVQRSTNMIDWIDIGYGHGLALQPTFVPVVLPSLRQNYFRLQRTHPPFDH